MEKNDGGPAFPRFDPNAPDRFESIAALEAWRKKNLGMSLRDYFAAKAMEAIFDSDAGHSYAEIIMIAAEAYAMADAMIDERGK